MPHGGPDTPLPEIRQRPDRISAPARQHILATTNELLGDAQLHELSVQDILVATGFSRPTFYSYFSSKIDVVVALYANAVTDIHDSVRQMYDRPEGQSPSDAIRVGIASLVEAWSQHTDVFCACMEHRYTVPELMDQSIREISYFAVQLGNQLEHDREAGLAPAGPPAAPLLKTLLWSTEHALYIAARGIDSDLPDQWKTIDPVTTMWISSLYPGADED